MKILVIAPHPDDEVLGCGGTITKHTSRGDEVFLCVVTKAYSPEWSEDEIKTRNEEVLTVNQIIGIKKTYFLDFRTVQLDTIPLKDLVDSISGVINEVKPAVLFIPHRGDINLDHRLIFDAALVAARPVPVTTVKKILSYETLSETEWADPSADNAFTPNVYVDITGELNTKLNAMSEYRLELKEFPHPRSLEAISALARIRGATAGVEAAEAFRLIREIQ